MKDNTENIFSLSFVLLLLILSSNVSPEFWSGLQLFGFTSQLSLDGSKSGWKYLEEFN